MRLTRQMSLQSQPQEHYDLNEQKIYTIKCMMNSFYLREEMKTSKMVKEERIRIIGNYFDLKGKGISHLWMFKQVSNKEYEIVHVKTDLVVTIEDYEARLDFGKQSENQKFEIIQSSSGLRLKSYDGMVLNLDGILQSTQWNDRDETQFFRITPYDIFQCGGLRQTIAILTKNGQLAFDLENASRDKEINILLYKKNLRLNQRWIFEVLDNQKEDPTVLIKSALTGEYIIYNKQTDQLMQSTFAEQWRIHQYGDDLISIFNIKRNHYLSYNQINQFCLVRQENPNCKFKILQNKENGRFGKSKTNELISI